MGDATQQGVEWLDSRAFEQNWRSASILLYEEYTIGCNVYYAAHTNEFLMLIVKREEVSYQCLWVSLVQPLKALTNIFVI